MHSVIIPQYHEQDQYSNKWCASKLQADICNPNRIATVTWSDISKPLLRNVKERTMKYRGTLLSLFHVNALVLEEHNSSALAMEIPLSCNKTLHWYVDMIPRRWYSHQSWFSITLRARFMGPTWAHLGPTGPRWAPCWPHEHCYLGILSPKNLSTINLIQIWSITEIPLMIPTTATFTLNEGIWASSLAWNPL